MPQGSHPSRPLVPAWPVFVPNIPARPGPNAGLEQHDAALTDPALHSLASAYVAALGIPELRRDPAFEQLPAPLIAAIVAGAFAADHPDAAIGPAYGLTATAEHLSFDERVWLLTTIAPLLALANDLSRASFQDGNYCGQLGVAALDLLCDPFLARVWIATDRAGQPVRHYLDAVAARGRTSGTPGAWELAAQLAIELEARPSQAVDIALRLLEG